MTVAIVGVGEVEPAWKHDRPVLGLVVDAVRRALDDAGLTGSAVDGITTEAETMHGAGPDEVGVAIGFRDRRFTAQSSVAGAGVLAAVQLAELAIDAGLADVVVSYYGISLSTQAGGPYNIHAEDPNKAALEMPFGFFGQPVYFAALAQRYAHEFGLTSEQLSSVPIAARAFARRTPGALATDPLDLEGYLADRVVADPLRRLDCCLINDAAAAFVMTSAERARDLRRPVVLVAGTGFGTKPVTEAGYFTDHRNISSRKVTGPPAGVDVANDSLALWAERYLDLAVHALRFPEVETKITRHLRRFGDWFSDGFGHDRISAVTPRDVTAWRDHLAAHGNTNKHSATSPMAAATVNNPKTSPPATSYTSEPISTPYQRERQVLHVSWPPPGFTHIAEQTDIAA